MYFRICFSQSSPSQALSWGIGDLWSSFHLGNTQRTVQWQQWQWQWQWWCSCKAIWPRLAPGTVCQPLQPAVRLNPRYGVTSVLSLQAGLFKELVPCCQTPAWAVHTVAPTAAGSGEGFAPLWELWALGVMPGAVPMKQSTTRPKLTWSTCCVIQHQQRAVCSLVQPHMLAAAIPSDPCPVQSSTGWNKSSICHGSTEG